MQVACSYKSFKTFLRKIHQTAGNLKFKYETSEQKSKKNSKKMNKKKKLYKKKKRRKKMYFERVTKRGTNWIG